MSESGGGSGSGRAGRARCGEPGHPRSRRPRRHGSRPHRRRRAGPPGTRASARRTDVGTERRSAPRLPSQPPAGAPPAARSGRAEPPAGPPASGWGANAARPAAPRTSGPPPAPAGPPPAGGTWGATGGPPPPPVKPGGIPGCLKALIIVGVLLIVALVLFVFVLIGRFARQPCSAGRAASTPTSSPDPNAIGDNGAIGDECPFLTDDEARQVLGRQRRRIELTAASSRRRWGSSSTCGPCPRPPDCGSPTARRRTSPGSRGHDGNGPRALRPGEGERPADVAGPGRRRDPENPGYFGGDVSGLGDEAFCTGLSNAIMAGVVVRQGDTVVWPDGRAARGRRDRARTWERRRRRRPRRPVPARPGASPARCST